MRYRGVRRRLEGRGRLGKELVTDGGRIEVGGGPVRLEVVVEVNVDSLALLECRDDRARESVDDDFGIRTVTDFEDVRVRGKRTVPGAEFSCAGNRCSFNEITIFGERCLEHVFSALCRFVTLVPQLDELGPFDEVDVGLSRREVDGEVFRTFAEARERLMCAPEVARETMGEPSAFQLLFSHNSCEREAFGTNRPADQPVFDGMPSQLNNACHGGPFGVMCVENVREKEARVNGNNLAYR